MLVCTFAFVGCAAIPAVREAVVKTIITEYEKFFNLNVSSDKPFERPIEPKTLTYVPDGFELIQEDGNNASHIFIYLNLKDNSILSFSQMIISDDDIHYNNEGNEVFYINYNDLEIMAIQLNKNNNVATTLVWHDDIYLYEIYGDISIYDGIQILKGIK